MDARRLGVTRPATGVSGRLQQRSALAAAVRGFFAGRGFLEVETPALVEAPGSEPHLEPMAVAGGGWLITSPEHHMKRLLARERIPRIFQICRCFRGGECSPLHRPEFTMVEWYRAHAGYGRVVADVEALVAHVALAMTGTTRLCTPSGVVDVTPPWPWLTVADAMARFGGVPPEALLQTDDGGEALRHAAGTAGCVSVDSRDDWESAFHKLLVERVEPALAALRHGVHLRDYPAPLAALARLKPSNPAVAERVESYAGGFELANGFGELVDPRQQRRRFGEARCLRRRAGLIALPVDEPFLRDLADMPPSAGVALGFDRLAMLVLGAQRIDDTVAF